MSRPGLALALAFFLGSLGALAGVLAGALASLAALAARRPGLALAGVAVAAGGAAALAESRFIAEAPAALARPVDGRVRHVEQRGATLYAVVAPDEAPAWGVRVALHHRPPGLAAGARVRLLGPLLPLDPADNPGGFDAEAWAARRQVRWRSREPIALLAPASAAAIVLQDGRDAARRHLDAVPRAYGAAVLRGLLLGDRAAVPAEALRGFNASGTAHLLAVSGLHVGGLAWVLALGVRHLGHRRRWRRVDALSAAVALPAVTLFVFLAQAPLSAVRAGVMVGLYALGRALGRPPNPLNLLGFAALLALLDAPSVAAEPGFQLSFGAVAALLTLATRQTTWWRSLLQVSVIAWLATAPIQAAHFGTFSPVAPLANVLLVPFASLVLVPLGLLGLALAPLTLAPLTFTAALAEALAALAEGFGQWPGLWVVGAHGAAWLAVPLVLWIGRRRLRLALPAAAACVAAGFALRPPDATVDFVAVGQGDAMIVRGGGQVLLVDTGPPTGADALLAYLRHEGIGRVDRVIISHGHPDHDGGLEALAAEIPIGEVWTHGRALPTDRWRRIRAALGPTPVRRAPLGHTPLGPLAVEVLLTSPPADLEENDASVALRVVGPAGSVLLTGDLEAGARPG
ncbi:MAG: ComEC/Rec2 family competence protein [bacterium]